MTDKAEIDALVDAEIDAVLKAKRRAERDEIAFQLRRKAAAAEYDRINARHPVEDKYGGLGPAGHAARLKDMDARARADMEHMDRSNSRPVPGSLAARRADSAGGSSGFEVKRGPR
jgi:hypothetical protein